VLFELSLVVAAALAGWASMDVLISSLLAPVQPVSDAPIYHLYFAIRWWQSGYLEIVPTPFGESAAPYFPANGNVWFTWLILPWSSEAVAKVGQWPFLGIGMLAIWGLALELPVSGAAALVPALLWGTGTLAILHTGIADVDLIMAAWYLVGIFFLVRYVRGGELRDLVCTALALGAVLGTKFISILLVPWPLGLAALWAFRGSGRWRHLMVLGVFGLVPSGFWYLRNAVLFGNPLYPLQLELWGLPFYFRLFCAGWTW
jgi:hypothetical protein